ncbi:MAG TPA: hypothetical protein VMX54_08270 [Vicinamibacteria bacterium]|nr:hypothetical protein [Vicinamibacteria bacterium]
MGRASRSLVTAACCVCALPVQAQARKPPARASRPAASSAARVFKVEVEQDGKPVPIRDHEALLRRAPFALLLTLPDASDVFVSASFEPATYDVARSGAPFGKEDFRSAISGAEGPANAGNDIFVRGPDRPILSVWSCSLGRFDQLTTVGAGCRGRRTIEKVFTSEPVPLDRLLRRPLHLVFLRGTVNEAGVEKELGREWLTLYLDTVPDAMRAATETQLKAVFDGHKPTAERAAALQALAAMGPDAITSLDVIAFDAAVRAREAAAVADLRAILSAESAYASVNGGLYDGPPCLVEPQRCRPKFTGKPFLQAATLQTRNGYKREFQPGTAASRDEIRKANASATALKDFVLAAWPEMFGETGYRAFCADSSGRICSVEGATAPVKFGRCTTECAPLP